MKIAAADVFAYRLQLARPLPGKSSTGMNRRGCLVRLRSDSDVVGWGEAAPLPGFSRESFDNTGRQLGDLKGRLLHSSVSPRLAMLTGGFEEWLGQLKLLPSVQCAVEMAVLNLLAADQSKPLAGLLMPNFADAVYLNSLIPDDASVIEAANECRRDGYRAVKMKVGTNSVDVDIGRTRMLARELGEGVSVRLDANRAWSFDDAVRFASGIGDCHVKYIEEPLADWTGLGELHNRTNLPIALDESLVDLSPEQLPEHEYASAVILKPTLLGGFERAATFARAAGKINIRVVISSGFESSVGIAALANLAAAFGTPDTMAGLDTLGWFSADLLTQPIDRSNGRMRLEQIARVAANINESLLSRLDND